MGLINLRDLLSFPANGDNSTDTVINGVHFNLTALNYWNYTLYSNNTISNDSNCFIIFDQYQPSMLANGTWVNATSCYVPIFGLRERGKLGVAFGAIFAVSIMFTLLNLKKHGQQFLREDKRFRIVGRRWQWYWMLFVAGCGIISTLTSLDVDRDYLQQIAIILQSLFFYLMVPGTLAMVWEATRHWGSWQERQVIDRDPFSLPQDDRRGRAEFYMPLIFYLFAWLNFFMTIPRAWGAIQMQRSLQQQTSIAEPAATDGRFKAAGILAALAYFTIIYNLRHNLYYYRRHVSGWWRSFDHAIVETPLKLLLGVTVLGVQVAYVIASAWEWNISLMKYDVQAGWPYGLGYGSSLLIIIIFNIFGYIDQNEDLLLVEQRRARGRAVDAELGITKRPAWWSKMSGDHHLTTEERLRAMTTEIGGGTATANRISRDVELRSMDRSNNPDIHLHRNTEFGAAARRDSELSSTAGLRDRSRSRPREDPFRDPSLGETRGREQGLRPALGREQSAMSTTSNTTEGSALTGTTANAQPQRVRSMLDI